MLLTQTEKGGGVTPGISLNLSGITFKWGYILPLFVDAQIESNPCDFEINSRITFF